MPIPHKRGKNYYVFKLKCMSNEIVCGRLTSINGCRHGSSLSWKLQFPIQQQLLMNLSIAKNRIKKH